MGAVFHRRHPTELWGGVIEGCYDGRVRLVVLVVRDDVILLSASFTYDLCCMSFSGLSSTILDT